LPRPAEACVDCGACEPACPVEAIYFEEELPTHPSGFLTASADYFATHAVERLHDEHEQRRSSDAGPV
jgi:ferredoxin